jgi:hypothetical protein
VLEVGKAGSAGVERGVLPLLADGVVVATLRSARWKEAATAVVGNREWVFRRAGQEVTGRWATEPEKAVRFRARQTSFWKGVWTADLEGTTAEIVPASVWRSTNRYLVDGQVVAESGTTGGWRMRPVLTTSGALSLDGQVFLLWVELLRQRRSAAVAASGAA